MKKKVRRAALLSAAAALAALALAPPVPGGGIFPGRVWLPASFWALGWLVLRVRRCRQQLESFGFRPGWGAGWKLCLQCLFLEVFTDDPPRFLAGGEPARIALSSRLPAPFPAPVVTWTVAVFLLTWALLGPAGAGAWPAAALACRLIAWALGGAVFLFARHRAKARPWF